MWIALSGWATAGKDSVADILEEGGFIRRAFADPLRQFTQDVNPIVAFDDGRPVRYNDALSLYG